MPEKIEKLILYHGSSSIVEKPVFGGGKLYNDYGQGFYCTENIELAKEWACSEKVDGYANKYEIKISDLEILNLSSNQLKHAMALGKLGEQFVLKSQKSFEQIKFVDFTLADNSIYYAKRKSRDDEARAAFKKELENEDLDGIFMRDILREEMKANDSRLR